MNIYAFPPLAWALEIGYQFLYWLSNALTPLTAGASAGLAVILLTLVVRSILIPVGFSQVRGELGRARIAPQLKELQRKHAKNPQLLSEKTLALYKTEEVSMFAGIGPALLQAPVLMVVYGLFVLGQIGGHPNTLLEAAFGGAPLGQSLLRLVSTGSFLSGGWIYLAVLAVIMLVAEYNRRRAAALSQANQLDQPGQAKQSNHVPEAAIAGTSTLTRLMPWLSYLTAVTALFVPLAAALYLATTMVWTAVERALIRRALTPSPGPEPLLA